MSSSSEAGAFPKREFAVLAGALIIAACAGVGLAFDGSFLWFHAVEQGQPFIPHHRMINAITQAGGVFASRYIHDVRIISALFSLPYVLVPLISLLLSWAVIRRRAPGLLVWSVGWVLLAPLPGQMDILSEAYIMLQLAWPLFLIGLLGVRWRDVPIGVLLCGIEVISYPGSVVILVLAAITCAAGAALNPTRRALSVAAALGLFAAALADVWWLSHRLTGYESSMLGVHTLVGHLLPGFIGEPLIFVLLVWKAYSLLLNGDQPSQRTPIRLLLIAGLCLAFRAAFEVRWRGDVSYHYYAIAVALPFLGAAAFDVYRARHSDGGFALTALRYKITQISIAIAAVIVLIHAASWIVFSERLRASIRAAPQGCISIAETPVLAWARGSVASYWSATTLGFWMQSAEPDHLLVYTSTCDAFTYDRTFQIDPWQQYPWGHQWFDLRSLGISLQSGN